MKTVQIQRQRQVGQRHGCQSASRAGRPTPTTPPRRPSCRRSGRLRAARWLGWDPIGESGGANLFGFLDNDPASYVDVLGQVKKWYNPYAWIYDPDQYVYHAPLPLPERPRRQESDDPFAELESGPFGRSLRTGCKTLQVSEAELREAQEKIREVLKAPVEGAFEAGSLFIGPGAAKGAVQAGGKAASKSGWWQRVVGWLKREKCAAKSGAMVRGSSEAFNSALFQEATKTVENVGGFKFYGNKGFVGDTFNRNVFLIEAEQKGAASLRGMVNALEGEARASGANQLSIIGHEVINPGFLNPAIAQRYVFTFRQINPSTVQLIKPLP